MFVNATNGRFIGLNVKSRPRFRNSTHVALEVREVKVGDEQDRLGLNVGHRLEDGHVVSLLEEGYFYI